MIPDDSLKLQLLERNQVQGNLPHLSLPTPILKNWLFFLDFFDC